MERIQYGRNHHHGRLSIDEEHLCKLPVEGFFSSGEPKTGWLHRRTGLFWSMLFLSKLALALAFGYVILALL